MDFTLENIPAELWNRVRSAASSRGLSERSFLLNAAFNELERTDNVFLAQENIEVPAIESDSSGSDVKGKVASAVRGKSVDELYAFVAKEIGVEESQLRERFRNAEAHGTQRLSLCNVLRGFYRGEDEEGRHLRNLRTVGIRTFVQDQLIFRLDRESAVKYFQQEKGFSKNTANTKFSTAKRILSDKEANDFCWNYVVNNAAKVDEETRELAIKQYVSIYGDMYGDLAEQSASMKKKLARTCSNNNESA